MELVFVILNIYLLWSWETLCILQPHILQVFLMWYKSKYRCSNGNNIVKHFLSFVHGVRKCDVLWILRITTAKLLICVCLSLLCWWLKPNQFDIFSILSFYREGLNINIKKYFSIDFTKLRTTFSISIIYNSNLNKKMISK